MNFILSIVMLMVLINTKDPMYAVAAAFFAIASEIQVHTDRKYKIIQTVIKEEEKK